jgi:hypothetical protein
MTALAQTLNAIVAKEHFASGRLWDIEGGQMEPQELV